MMKTLKPSHSRAHSLIFFSILAILAVTRVAVLPVLSAESGARADFEQSLQRYVDSIGEGSDEGAFSKLLDKARQKLKDATGSNGEISDGQAPLPQAGEAVVPPVDFSGKTAVPSFPAEGPPTAAQADARPAAKAPVLTPSDLELEARAREMGLATFAETERSLSKVMALADILAVRGDADGLETVSRILASRTEPGTPEHDAALDNLAVSDAGKVSTAFAEEKRGLETFGKGFFASLNPVRIFKSVKLRLSSLPKSRKAVAAARARIAAGARKLTPPAGSLKSAAIAAKQKFLDDCAGAVTTSDPPRPIDPDTVADAAFQGTLLDPTLADSARAIRICRDGLSRMVGLCRDRADLFPGSPDGELRMVDRAAKLEVWNIWKSFLDYQIVLGNLVAGALDEAFAEGPIPSERPLTIALAAYGTQYRFALEFIGLLDKDPTFDILLNDEVPELGVAIDSYLNIRKQYIGSPVFAARYKVLKGAYVLLGSPEFSGLEGVIAEDWAFLEEIGWTGRFLLRVSSYATLLKKGSVKAWNPCQVLISDIAGHTKVKREGIFLVTPEQVRGFLDRLAPGDFFLTRREWFLSNIGIPGFWCHAGLFIGTAAERTAFFDDETVKSWIRSKGAADGNLETLLAKTYPEAYGTFLATNEDGGPGRTIEAVGQGVLFHSAEKGFGADSVAVLRPELPKVEIARAIFEAFQYFSRPYDYYFDCLTDKSICCSELVQKAYEPAPGFKGIDFDLQVMMNGKVLAPNDMAAQFDREASSAGRQFTLVLFLDGSEKEMASIERDEAVFRSTATRPKWYFLNQE